MRVSEGAGEVGTVREEGSARMGDARASRARLV